MPRRRETAFRKCFLAELVGSLCLLLVISAPGAEDKKPPDSKDEICEEYVREKCEELKSTYVSHETRSECTNTAIGMRSPCCTGKCENGRRPQVYWRTERIDRLRAEGFDVEKLRELACPQLALAVPPVPSKTCKRVTITFDPTINEAYSRALPRWSVWLPTAAPDDMVDSWTRRTVATLYHELRELRLRESIGSQTPHVIALMEEMSNACHFGLYEDRAYMESFASRVGLGRIMRKDCRQAPERRVAQWKKRVLFSQGGRFGHPAACDTDNYQDNVKLVRRVLEKSLREVRVEDAAESGHHRFQAVIAEEGTFTLFVQEAVMRGDPAALEDELVELDVVTKLSQDQPMLLDVCGLIEADGWMKVQSAK